MKCIRCQTVAAARASGNEQSLIDELYRQIDVLLGQPQRENEDVVPRVEHEQVVRVLNETIVARNAEIENLRRKIA